MLLHPFESSSVPGSEGRGADPVDDPWDEWQCCSQCCIPLIVIEVVQRLCPRVMHYPAAAWVLMLCSPFLLLLSAAVQLLRCQSLASSSSLGSLGRCGSSTHDNDDVMA